MDFSKIVLRVALTLLFVVNDSTQFLVANCVWDEALSDAPLSDLRGFVLSDADACALFCSKPSSEMVSALTDTHSATSSSNAALCDRCCKSSQPASKPGELLVSILHTLIKAFGPSKDPPNQTISTDAGQGAPPPDKPTQEPPIDKPSTQPETPDPGDVPMFDTGDLGHVDVSLNDDGKAKPAEFVDRFNNHGYENGPSTAGTRARRYPEARIIEIAGRDNGGSPTFSDGFDRATDRGPGWPHLAANFPVKSGTIR